jgi:hypothetical protein
MLRTFQRLLFLSFFILLSAGMLAQNTANTPSAQIDEPGILLMKEAYTGVYLHSHGIGINHRMGRHLTGKKKLMWDLDFSTMKHPKELRVQNPYLSNSRSYVYGKLNSVMMLRGGYGMQKELYSRELPGAVEVKWVSFVGFSLAVAKPIYLEIVNRNSRTELEKYDPEKHTTDNIFGKGPFLKGLNEIKFIPGAYYKGGLNFDYAGADDAVKAIETGVIVDFHPRPVPIMAYNTSNPLIVSFYVCLTLGKRSN